jgi:hypothetical protein
VTPDQEKDAAHLSQALWKSRDAWFRESNHADQFRLVALISGVVGVGGLVFRNYVQELEVFVFVGLVAFAIIAFFSYRRSEARWRRAAAWNRRLSQLAEKRGYPLDWNGTYIGPPDPGCNYLASPYDHDPDWPLELL